MKQLALKLASGLIAVLAICILGALSGAALHNADGTDTDCNDKWCEYDWKSEDYGTCVCKAEWECEMKGENCHSKVCE